VITIVSSTDADVGVIVIVGAGIVNAVVVPVIEPTVTDTIATPGAKEPPFVAAGISVTTEKPPRVSVMKPPVGIPLAVAKVRVDPVVLGGKLLPVTVTLLPVDTVVGETEIVPVGIFKLAVATRLAVALREAKVGFSATALSVAVMRTVEARVPVGTVTTPVPEPSDPTGNVEVPVKVRPVTVNVAVVVFSPLSTVIPVTETVTD